MLKALDYCNPQLFQDIPGKVAAFHCLVSHLHLHWFSTSYNVRYKTAVVAITDTHEGAHAYLLCLSTGTYYSMLTATVTVPHSKDRSRNNEKRRQSANGHKSHVQ